MLDIESKINAVCYHCDLCRTEIHSFEYAYHSLDENYDYCVSCTHSIYAQHQVMKPFLAKILKEKMNEDCIEEIVAFCIGKVNQYAIGPEEPEATLEEKMSELRVS